MAELHAPSIAQLPSARLSGIVGDIGRENQQTALANARVLVVTGLYQKAQKVAATHSNLYVGAIFAEAMSVALLELGSGCIVS